MTDNAVCYVYLMEDTLYSGIKIGISEHPEERKKKLEWEFGTKIAIRYIVEFPKRSKALRQERRMHREFAPYRADGEWFRLSTDQVMARYPHLDYVSIDLETESDFMDDLTVIADMRLLFIDLAEGDILSEKVQRIAAYIEALTSGDPMLDFFRQVALSQRNILGERFYKRWKQGRLDPWSLASTKALIINAFWDKLVELGVFETD